MSTEVASASEAEAAGQVDKRLELVRRFILAGFVDPTRFDDIPRGVLLFLLPDDDPAFVEREIAAGTASARRGKDVYFRHIHVADLPD